VGGDDPEVLWAAECTAVGGFYDPVTGRLDLTKLGVSRARLLTALHDRYEVAAVAFPSIVARTAPFTELHAKWDGVKRAASGRLRATTPGRFLPARRKPGSTVANQRRPIVILR